MASRYDINTAALTIAELREFADFEAATQRYIRRSLDIGLGRADAFDLWARDKQEASAIRSHYLVYQDLPVLRCIVPLGGVTEAMEEFTAKLQRVTAFDLAQGKIGCFSAYRFLYERLVGPTVRPWLPSAFCGAAALPHIEPLRRKLLLQSISEAAATAPGWSDRPPVFYPEWVEKVEAGSVA